MIVILEEILMIEKVLLDLYFSWVIMLSLGVLKSNQLSHFQHMNSNMWRLLLVFVMPYGSEDCWKKFVCLKMELLGFILIISPL